MRESRKLPRPFKLHWGGRTEDFAAIRANGMFLISDKLLNATFRNIFVE